MNPGYIYMSDTLSRLTWSDLDTSNRSIAVRKCGSNANSTPVDRPSINTGPLDRKSKFGSNVLHTVCANNRSQIFRVNKPVNKPVNT